MGGDSYWDAIDRNLGVITPDEQQTLHDASVSIAGCGGMGGLVAVTCARLGIRRIKIADNQSFDHSNLNRQYSARFETIGRNKAEITAADIRAIFGSQIKVVSYSGGVCRDNVVRFVDGASIILDEIEFYEKRARMMLHQAARAGGVSVLNCNVVGFGTRIFKFTPESMTMEEFLGLDPDTPLDEDEISRLIDRLAPQPPPDITPDTILSWVKNPDPAKRKVPIFGGTPPISSGILAVRMVLEILGPRAFQSRPWLQQLPVMPGYAYFDAGRFIAGVHHGKWW